MPEVWIAVTPRAHREDVGPYRDGVLTVRVTRPPADGEANRALLRLVAKALRVPPGRVTIVGGLRARRKRLHVDGIRPDELDRRLAGLAREAQVGAGRLRVDDPGLAAAQFIGLLQAGVLNELLFGVREAPDAAEVERIVDAAVAVFLARYGVA